MTAWGDVLACATCVGWPWSKVDVGFLWSALFLMVLPIGVAGLIGGWLFYAYRRSAGRDRAGRANPHLIVTEKESGQ